MIETRGAEPMRSRVGSRGNAPPSSRRTPSQGRDTRRPSTMGNSNGNPHDDANSASRTAARTSDHQGIRVHKSADRGSVPATPAEGHPDIEFDRVSEYLKDHRRAVATDGELTGLRDYFGWQRKQTTYRYFGLDVRLLGLSPTDLVLASVASAYTPLLLLGLVYLAATLAHSATTRGHLGGAKNGPGALAAGAARPATSPSRAERRRGQVAATGDCVRVAAPDARGRVRVVGLRVTYRAGARRRQPADRRPSDERCAHRVDSDGAVLDGRTSHDAGETA